MEPLAGLTRYFESLRYAPSQGGSSGQRYPFLTLSRQAGSGGYALARMLLDRMREHADQNLFGGWYLLDALACQRFLEEEHLHLSLDSLVAEQMRSWWEDLIYGLVAKEASQEQVVQRLCSKVRALAKRGRVIILGRAAAALTRDLGNGFHVRLLAPYPARVRRMMRLTGVGEERARRLIDEKDRSRERFVRVVTGRDAGDPLLYDALFNTERLPIAEIAGLILFDLENRFKDRVEARTQDLSEQIV